MTEVPLNPAKRLLSYLSPSDPLLPADLIIGFGHFDQRIPARCVRLYQDGFAPRILFTGGVGSGSGDFQVPEAHVFLEIALRLGVPREHLLIESKSTNTTENIQFSLALLGAQEPPLPFNRVILVANPYRMRRVGLTFKKNAPDAQFLHAPPLTNLETEQALFRMQHLDLYPLLTGEVARLHQYGEAGYFDPISLPTDIEAISADFKVRFPER